MRRTEPGRGHQDIGATDVLQELDELQAREPLPDIEPPALVDQAVRNQARRELQHNPAPPLAVKLRWIAGLSTVSIALLAIGISMVQSPRMPQPATPALQQERFRPGPERQASRAPEATTESRLKSRAKREAAGITAAELHDSEPSGAPGEADSASADPAWAWLDLIHQLYQQGMVAEAAEQLVAFRRQHPDHELPEWTLELQQEQE